MEYYIVRIYRRKSCQSSNGDLCDIRITGLLEGYNGHKATFHDAETLWKLLAQDLPAAEPHGAGNDGGGAVGSA